MSNQKWISKHRLFRSNLEIEVGYRKLAAKYGISRTTINKWAMIHQGVHNISATQKQQQYLSRPKISLQCRKSRV
jgi:biotin operon repressor